MTTYIALLRGINVGGHKNVAMADLRDLFVELGFGDVRTLLQSGNVVFRTKSRPTAKLEQLLEYEAERRLGLTTKFIVRTAEEWKNLIERNPLVAEAERDPARMIVMFLKAVPGSENIEALQAAIRGREVVRSAGQQLYIVYPDGMGRSRLTGSVIEKKLGTMATGRNWNTVMKLESVSKV
jgi:uncharacterized protein (DUF1697 family)